MNLLGFLERSGAAALLVLFIVCVRCAAGNRIHRRVFVILWGIVLLRLFIPVSLPANIGLGKVQNQLSTMAKGSGLISPGTPSETTLAQDMLAQDKLYQGISSLVTQIARVLPLLWFAGVSALFIYFTTTYLRTARKIRDALPLNQGFAHTYLNARRPSAGHIRLFVSDRIATPLACGVFRQRIVLPRLLNHEDERSIIYIMEHELCHLRHFHQIWKVLAAAALCLHWFNPMVWLMFFLLQRDLEIACDEEVIHLVGETDKQAYALTLLELAAAKSGLSALHNAFGKNIAKERITAIMKYKKTTLSGLAFSAFLIFGGMTVFASGSSVPARESNEPTPSSVQVYSYNRSADENYPYTTYISGTNADINIYSPAESSGEHDSHTTYRPGHSTIVYLSSPTEESEEAFLCTTYLPETYGPLHIGMLTKLPAEDYPYTSFQNGTNYYTYLPSR